ncbi:cysteine hydrolase [Clostridium sp. AM16-23]|jgi:nicotinamidase/pyrazinamidase|nr:MULTISPECIES: isochorismatase family cysteine hydrolase [unclassified Clostridium]RHO34909.1 cysteine hydrolase [Clostridium sp. AM16-23]RHV96084.1 cysteine hydrolase [Clostridium sp. OF09-10]
MAEKILIVVDMQKDFVNGSLGSKDAETIVPAVVKKAKEFDGDLIFTKDTHFENYMDTQEGHFLPVPHCIKGTDGWDLIPELEKIAIERDAATYEKITFGCPELAEDLLERNKKTPIESIELVGLCTDICVVSNALLIKAFLPETPVFVDSACAAGVTREKHEAALETMRSCQIVVK